MFTYTQTYAGASVNDIAKAKAFYGNTLGLEMSEIGDSLMAKTADSKLFLYPKENHQPATYTMFNFEVEDIEAAVKQLKEKGVQFENYPEAGTGEDGISRTDYGPLIAWFKDPAGNILSVVQA